MLNVERIPISKIRRATYNPRHNLQPGDPEYEKLLKSIDEFDCVEPSVWNRRTGNLLSGHQRLKILAARGDREVMCSVVDLPPAREKVLNLALNKISGDWDNKKLVSMLYKLIRIPDFDIEVTGFDLSEASQLIDQLLPENADENDDFDVEAKLQQIAEPKTKSDELIELGPHRILCGDCTDIPMTSPARCGRPINELATIELHITSAGKIMVEPKENIKKRLGLSPDHADALALTYASGGRKGSVYVA